jgi:phosphoglycolate phosphatase-like HAD superfamily hydrolase
MTTGCVPAVVFDLDGTLADTATDVQRALNRALASDDLPPIDTSTGNSVSKRVNT